MIEDVVPHDEEFALAVVFVPYLKCGINKAALAETRLKFIYITHSSGQ